MNGISRVSTWMCDAIVSILHSVSLDVRRDYVQDERYIAGEHMDVRRDYVQDERYIAGEHMDVRRDCVNFAQCFIRCAARLCSG